MQITGVNNLQGSNNLTKTTGTKNKGTDFGALLNDAIDNVNKLQVESDEATNSFINGQTDNIHNVMIASSKANLALQMTIQVRNKVMDAYNEIMNMNL
ncbi:MAG: flagellar hook-basal body complex protein FliE [Clostridia bacterium]|nr:flagellar hook-basal body complex protein FliE [Clostridia bacterium]